jgi:hypothetical protein
MQNKITIDVTTTFEQRWTGTPIEGVSSVQEPTEKDDLNR